MVWISIGILTLWLLVLTVVAAGIVRYLGTLALARTAGQLPLVSMDFDADGPEVGTPLPAAVLDVLRRRSPGAAAPQRLLLFVSPGCGTCLEAASELARRAELRDRSNVFVLGASKAATGTVTELLDALRPVAEAVVTDDDARTAMQSLRVNSVPFVVTTVDGRVSGKLFVRRVPQLRELLDQFAGQLTGHLTIETSATGTGRTG
jgi:hypothetical protein